MNTLLSIFPKVKRNQGILYLFYILSLSFIFILISPFILLKKILFLYPRFILKISVFLVMGLAVLFWVAFIIQLNKEAIERNLVVKYHQEIKEIIKEKNKLEVELGRENLAITQSHLINMLNFEKVNKIQQAKIISSQMVKK